MNDWAYEWLVICLIFLAHNYNEKDWSNSQPLRNKCKETTRKMLLPFSLKSDFITSLIPTLP